MYKFNCILFFILLLVLSIIILKNKCRYGCHHIFGGNDLNFKNTVLLKNIPPKNIKWDGPSTCYPTSMIKECQIFFKKYINKNCLFGIPSTNDIKAFQNFADILSNKYKIPISTNTCLSIYYMEVQFEIQIRTQVIKNYSKDIISYHKNGKSIIEISKQLYFPPLAILKLLLSSKGVSESAIKEMISMKKLMHNDLINEATEIFKADITSKFNSDNIFKASQLYEVFAGSHLKTLDILFRTEKDLRKENYQLTPDFLLNSPVYINGQIVNWIDVKNYTLYKNRFLSQRLLQQSIKYTKAFGNGAMIFSGGITCDVLLDNNTLLLDGSHIEHIVSIS